MHMKFVFCIFSGGLPPDIDEDEITVSFRRFGPLVVDWPHKAESKSYFPPKGYAFLLFQVSILIIKNIYNKKIFFTKLILNLEGILFQLIQTEQ